MYVSSCFTHLCYILLHIQLIHLHCWVVVTFKTDKDKTILKASRQSAEANPEDLGPMDVKIFQQQPCLCSCIFKE